MNNIAQEMLKNYSIKSELDKTNAMKEIMQALKYGILNFLNL